MKALTVVILCIFWSTSFHLYAEDRKIQETEIKEKISYLEGWRVHEGKIVKDFVFEDFIHAFQFMQCVAVEAEIMNHHPEWSNVYNRVHIALITHDAGPGLSHKDFSLAQKIDEVFKDNKYEKKYTRNLRLGLGSSYLFQKEVPSFKYGYGLSSRYEFILNPKFRLGIQLSLNRSPQKSYQLVYGLIMQHHFLSFKDKKIEPYVSYGLLMQLMKQHGEHGYGTAHDTRGAFGVDFEILEKPLFAEIGYNFSRLKYFSLPDVKWDHIDITIGWNTPF